MAAPRLFLLLCLLVAFAACLPQRKNQPGSRSKAPPPRAQQEDDEQFSDECPEPNGYFADAEQCDKYYACTEGVIEERLCPDGMVFNDFSSQHEKCDLPFGIDCSQRPKLQTPQPSTHCPRKHGYFAHADPKICDKFYYCVDGMFNAITCPDGLVYSAKTGICTWPDEAQKKHCSSEDVFNFSCPKTNQTGMAIHPRYADPEDCQFFYVCINGETPRRNGCMLGKVFNDATKSCDSVKNVPECKDWYKGILTDAELERLDKPKPKPKTPSESATTAPHRSRRPSQKAKPAEVSHEEDEA
ncbi:Hypothetical predicted protein [Cloeon dipterum]|uniref:Chitin-binding type-2 domain-containing protein n=2 Tax=Cloeon dipterum TaxID=197152 RepID=A0A8S1DDB5_9INSE|nr:Hypothetical predicted protein [Cloeon dipterum]